MTHVLLINPNTSRATTEMMVRIAMGAAEGAYPVVGATAHRGPPMILKAADLRASAAEVERCWQEAGAACVGVVISAYGDPGIERVRAAASVPVAGICESSMLEASEGGRRFGIATVTPDLVEAIDAHAHALGLREVYTGIRLTEGDPQALAADPRALTEALAGVVQQCIERDGAEAVIIGGGPLGQAAIELAPRFAVPIVAPIPAAMRQLALRMRRGH